MRQIVLDTETTGLEPSQGHRVIEIGCVELKDRRKTEDTFHQCINPEREIEDGAYEDTGLAPVPMRGINTLVDSVGTEATRCLDPKCSAPRGPAGPELEARLISAGASCAHGPPELGPR